MNWKMVNPKDVKFKQVFRIFVAVLMLAVVLLVGCQGQNLLESILPESGDILDATSTPAIPREETALMTMTATATTPVNTQLTIWVPPQFSPYDETETSQLLSERLKAFMLENPQINLDIRVKAASGAASILDTLTYASQVAPDGMPSLVLISRSDLETAVQRGLVQTIEEVSTQIDESDWFDFARNMGIVQGTAYGLPFAADALGLVYRNASLTSSQPDWDELMVQFNSLVFPAADPSVLITLALYLSAGGVIQDTQGQAFIDGDILTLVLEAYQQGLNRGLFSASLLDLQSDDQAWEFFQTSEAEGLITWASRQLQDDQDFKLALMPTINGSSITLTKGWVWCLVEQDPQKKEYAGLLAEYMVAPEFLMSWAPISGYLPVRPTSVSGWENPVTQEIINNMLVSAQIRANSSQLSLINTSLKTAVQEILSWQNTPAESAQKAMQSLEVAE